MNVIAALKKTTAETKISRGKYITTAKKLSRIHVG